MSDTVKTKPKENRFAGITKEAAKPIADVDTMRKQAVALSNSPDASSFVGGATNSAPSPTVAPEAKPVAQPAPVPTKPAPAAKVKAVENPPTERMRKLLVEGQLKERGAHSKPMQLYLLNEHAEWMKNFATTGRGGHQSLINYLVRRGIQAVEAEFKATGIVFATEPPE